MKKVIGVQVYTVEELKTLFARIEGVMNSRALSPLSSDPKNLQALTSCHSLIGQPSLALPEHNLLNIHTNRLSNNHSGKVGVPSIYIHYRVVKSGLKKLRI